MPTAILRLFFYPQRIAAPIVLLFSLQLFLATSVFALEEISDGDAIPLPADLSRVHFYLITVDVGDRVWDNFGHTALRMVDENSYTDRVFNWGYFDASGGPALFAFDFFKGIMDYQMVVNSPEWEFAQYRQQGRSVWQDKINLSNQQKVTLYKRLVWNSQPENIVYPYHYFFDNCTTRVRDYLNEALGGVLDSTQQEILPSTFREQVRRHYESLGLIRFSLDVLMNSNIDRPMSVWESMFLPIQLRQNLLTYDSSVVEGSKRLPLLSEHEEVFYFAPPQKQADPYEVVGIVLLASVVLLCCCLTRVRQSYFATHSRLSLRLPGMTFRLLGLLGLVTALFSGTYGTLMLSSWLFSSHVDLHHNTNLLLFWPTDLLGIVVALRWLFFCKAWPLTHNNAPFINNYLLAHLLGMVIYSLVAWFGLSAQALQPLFVYVVPGFFLYTGLLWLVGFEPARPKNVFF